MSVVVVACREAINAIIETTLPEYKKLSDSIDLGDNPNIYLDKGYRVAYGPADRSGDEWCMTTIQRARQFTIFLTNSYVANLDPDQREAAENQFLTDQDLVVQAIHKSVDLTGVAISTDFTFDGGLEYLVDPKGQKQYLLIVTNITVDYFQEIP